MDVLPSLGRAAVPRSFDPAVWPEGTAMDGDDVLLRGARASSLVGGGPSADGVLVTRVARLVRSGPVVLCDVEGPVPAHCTLADVAWPGARLAGARMRQLLIRGADGARLAARVEVPADVAMHAVLVLALRMPRGAAAPGLRSGCVECDQASAGTRWTGWNSDDPRRNDDVQHGDRRVHRYVERLA